MNKSEVISRSKTDRRRAVEAARWAYSPRNTRACTDIFTAYSKPSAEKVAAWERCRRLCVDLDGHDLRIDAHNTWQFSVIFKFEDEAGREAVAYITAAHERYGYLDEAGVA